MNTWFSIYWIYLTIHFRFPYWEIFHLLWIGFSSLVFFLWKQQKPDPFPIPSGNLKVRYVKSPFFKMANRPSKWALRLNQDANCVAEIKLQRRSTLFSHINHIKSYPIGSMYAIYGNIYHQYTPNVSIYIIHGSYGYQIISTFSHPPTWLQKWGTQDNAQQPRWAPRWAPCHCGCGGRRSQVPWIYPLVMSK